MRPTVIVAAFVGLVVVVGLLAYSPGSGAGGGDDGGNGDRKASGSVGDPASASVSGTFYAKKDITIRNGPEHDRLQGETRAEFALEPTGDGKMKGTAAVTAWFDLEFKGREPCGLYKTGRIEESWVVQLTGWYDQGQLFINGDPERNPRRQTTLIGCAGGNPETIEADWMEFDIWRAIAFTDGRFDLRESWPVRERETGEMFQEIHMRRPGR